MVRKLLMEYNLSLSDIDTNEEQASVTVTQGEELSGSDRYGNHWKFQLLGVIGFMSDLSLPVIRSAVGMT